MAFTAQDVVNDVRQTYPDCTEDEALDLLNKIDPEICMSVPFRRDRVYIQVVAGQQEYSLDDTVLRMWSATLLTAPTTPQTLQMTNIDLLDEYSPGWRYAGPSSPSQVYTAENSLNQVVGFAPTSVLSTLVISGATNATPIVITTTQNHGLTTGDLVAIVGVLGNTAANSAAGSTWTVTVLTATTFSLEGSVGNGVYVSGGYVIAQGSPLISLEVTVRKEYILTTALPAVPSIFDVYVSGVKYRYAVRRDASNAGGLKSLFENDLAKQVVMYQNRNRVAPRIQTITQRAGGQYGGFVQNGAGCGGNWDG